MKAARLIGSSSSDSGEITTRSPITEWRRITIAGWSMRPPRQLRQTVTPAGYDSIPKQDDKTVPTLSCASLPLSRHGYEEDHLDWAWGDGADLVAAEQVKDQKSGCSVALDRLNISLKPPLGGEVPLQAEVSLLLIGWNVVDEPLLPAFREEFLVWRRI